MLLSRYYYYTYAAYCSACDNLILGEIAEAEFKIVYNIRVRVVSDIQTLAFGSSLYIRYNTAAHVVNITYKRCARIGL